jgi:hypothetical protein
VRLKAAEGGLTLSPMQIGRVAQSAGRRSRWSRRRPLERGHRPSTCNARVCPCGIQARSGDSRQSNRGRLRRLSSYDTYAMAPAGCPALVTRGPAMEANPTGPRGRLIPWRESTAMVSLRARKAGFSAEPAACSAFFVLHSIDFRTTCPPSAATVPDRTKAAQTIPSAACAYMNRPRWSLRCQA